MVLAIDDNAAIRWDDDSEFIENTSAIFNALKNSRDAGRPDDQKMVSAAEDLAGQLVYLYARDFPDKLRKKKADREQRAQDAFKAVKRENKPGGLVDQAVSSMIETLNVDGTINCAYDICLKYIASQEYKTVQNNGRR